MENSTVIKTNIMTPLQDRTIIYKKNRYLTIEGSVIKKISSQPSSNCYQDYSNYLCIPGLIDLHVHLSQYNVRGKHADGLLEWLEKHIFVEELKANNPLYADSLAKDFFSALLSSGTTTAVVYVAPFFEACDIAFQRAQDSGLRTIMGQTLMDRNCPDFLCHSTEQSLEEAFALYEKWDKATPLLEYVFTPRFAPVCSSELMRGIGDFASRNRAFIQTHLSENKREIEWVRELFPDCRSYTEVYERHNLLGEKTLLGHAIHLSDEEMKIIGETKSKITHCPDSNFFLHSGRFPLERIRELKIDFALASDVGAGTTLFMPHVMKMFIYRQDDYPVRPEDAFYYSTLGSAKVLGKEKLIGSLEEGKEADLIFLKLPEEVSATRDDLLSFLTYLSTPENIAGSYIAGKRVFSKES